MPTVLMCQQPKLGGDIGKIAPGVRWLVRRTEHQFPSAEDPKLARSHRNGLGRQQARSRRRDHGDPSRQIKIAAERHEPTPEPSITAQEVDLKGKPAGVTLPIYIDIHLENRKTLGSVT